MLKYCILIAVFGFTAVLAKPSCWACKQRYWTNTDQTCEDEAQWKECLERVEKTCPEKYTPDANSTCNDDSTDAPNEVDAPEPGVTGLPDPCAGADEYCSEKKNIEAAKGDKEKLCYLAAKWRSCIHDCIISGCNLEVPYLVADTQAKNACTYYTL